MLIGTGVECMSCVQPLVGFGVCGKMDISSGISQSYFGSLVVRIGGWSMLGHFNQQGQSKSMTVTLTVTYFFQASCSLCGKRSEVFFE